MPSVLLNEYFAAFQVVTTIDSLELLSVLRKFGLLYVAGIHNVRTEYPETALFEVESPVTLVTSRRDLTFQSIPISFHRRSDEGQLYHVLRSTIKCSNVIVKPVSVSQ